VACNLLVIVGEDPMAHRTLLASIGLVSALGCAHHAAPPAAPAPAAPATSDPRGASARDPGGCPMDVPGAHVALTVLDGAIALDFTTSGDVFDLRRRVRALGEGVETDDLHNGARVTLAPADRSRTDELEARASRAVFELNRGDCSSLGRNWLALVGPDVDLRAGVVESARVETVRAMANRTPRRARR
jgi:hypothetical protein